MIHLVNKKLSTVMFICVVSIIMIFICACQMTTSVSGRIVEGRDFSVKEISNGIFNLNATVLMTITNDYYIAQTEVTQDLWEKVMVDSENNPNPSSHQGSPAFGEKQGKRPVENVTWYDAIEFCNILSEKTCRAPVYSFVGTPTRELSGVDKGSITTATVQIGTQMVIDYQQRWNGCGQLWELKIAQILQQVT